MTHSRFVPPLLLVLTIVFVFTSCSKDDGKSSKAAPTALTSQIRLDDALTEQGCLSVPKLLAGIRNLDPNLPLTVVPTSIAFDSQYAIRPGFRVIIAYGQLQLTTKSVASAQDVPDVTQDACAKLTITATDGIAQDFTVKSSARDSLVAEADDGSRVEYQWLGPQRILTQRRYPALDQPCSSSDKPVLVTVTKTLDWSGAGIPALVPVSGTPYSIDPAFLSLAAEAVGDDAGSLTTTDGDGNKLLDLTRVAAMTAKSPTPGALSCSGSVEPTPAPTPAPTPTPAPSPTPDPTNPTNPDDPNHPHDGGTPGH